MPKIIKRLLIVVLVLALVAGGTYGGLVAYKKANAKPVNVYSLENISMTEYWGDTSQTSGMVTTDKLQKVYVTPSQNVTEVCVTEGQTVSVGDPLLVYDSTLSDIDLQKAEISLKKLNADLEKAKKEFQVMQTLRPHVSVLITPPEKDITYTSEETPLIVSGSGTMDDPLYVLFGEDDAIDGALISDMMVYVASSVPAEKAEEPEDTSAPEESGESGETADPEGPSGAGKSENPSDPGETEDPLSLIHI